MRRNWIVLGMLLGGIFASLDVLGAQMAYQGFLTYGSFVVSLLIAIALYVPILGGVGFIFASIFSKYPQRGQIIFLWLMLVLAISNGFSPMLSIFRFLSTPEQIAFGTVYSMFIVLAFLNIRFWYRRTVVFTKVSPATWRNVALVIMGGALFVSMFSLYTEKNRSRSLEGDPPVFLISVRNWSALDFQKMSALQARVSQCDQYDRAVTPHTLAVPAYGALLTAKHPLHIPLWHNEQKIARTVRTIDQLFVQEKYGTAAFVSDEQAEIFGERFQIYDSPFDSFFSLVHKFALFRVLSISFWNKRSTKETWERAMEFAHSNPDEAQFIWIQLDHRGDVNELEKLLSQGMADIEADFPEARIALVGTQGRAFGVDREALQVPMMFCTPKTTGTHFMGLVRTMDVMNTLLARVPMQTRSDVDGTDLFSLRRNTVFSGFNTIVLSQSSQEEIPNSALAIFVATTGQKELYKYIYAEESSEEQLFSLNRDLLEAENIRAQKEHIARKVRQQALSVLRAIGKEQE